jgi:oleandomycin transport system ATP-binding protein
MDTTIEAHGLVKRFGDTTALGGVDLAARTGTVVAVLGPGPARVAAQLSRPARARASKRTASTVSAATASR